MVELKMSISGVRGIIGESLTPEIVLNFALAFGQFVNNNTHSTEKKVAVGMDSRFSGEMLKNIVNSGLSASGITAVDLGIIPSPTVLFAVQRQNCAGGIIITASHNPKEWNGFKFVSSKGQFLTQSEWNELYRLYEEKNFNHKPWDQLGAITLDFESADQHILSAYSLISPEKIKGKKYKVAYDAVNGAGSHITRSLLEKLGCDVYSIHDDPNEEFGRGPEPIPENLKDLEEFVVEQNCDIGFALDPDADRLAIVSEKGIAIGEEYTLVLAIDEFLQKTKTDIAVNVSTSRMIDDIANKHGVQVFRTAVGEINVLQGMIKNKCKIGGEGNGGVIIPEVNRARDSLIAMVMILGAMSSSSATITQLIDQIPKYYFVKDKINVEGINIETLYNDLLEKYKGESINQIDGIKIDFEDYWIQIRESNTEPIVRIFVEARTEELAKEKAKEMKDFIVTLK